LAIYPNTELWGTWQNCGTLLSLDWSKYTIWHPVFLPQGLTEKELITAHKVAYKNFYLRPRYWLDRLAKIRSFKDAKRYVLASKALLEFLS